MRLLFIGFLILPLSFASFTQGSVVIDFAGDSLVQTYPQQYITRGWGQTLPELFQPGNTFVNFALSGYSTKMFLNGTSDGAYPPRWNLLVSSIPKPNYVFISFGYNDAYNGPPYYTEKYSSPNEYKALLGGMVDDLKALNIEPILVTAPCNRNFVAGQLQNSVREYANAMIALGAEKSVGVVDLNASLASVYQSPGEAESNNLFGYLLANGVQDPVHFKLWGAQQVAQLIARDISTVSPGLGLLLKNTDFSTLDWGGGGLRRPIGVSSLIGIHASTFQMRRGLK